MSRRSVLITAFEPFGVWQSNSARLCLDEVLNQLPDTVDATARVYPVDFAAVRERLAVDLQEGFDFSVHLGQAQQSGRIRLESIAINMGCVPGQPEAAFQPLTAGGPVAYQSTLPLIAWAAMLRAQGIPAYVSYHAGTYLCNAVLYWAHQFIAERKRATRPCFVHLPLDVGQVISQGTDWPTLPAVVSAKAVCSILREMEQL